MLYEKYENVLSKDINYSGRILNTDQTRQWSNSVSNITRDEVRSNFPRHLKTIIFREDTGPILQDEGINFGKPMSQALYSIRKCTWQETKGAGSILERILDTGLIDKPYFLL